MRLKDIEILVVEDDIDLGSVLKQYLKMHGANVSLERNGKDGFELFQKQRFDICILDVMMPLIDGFMLAEKIQKHQNSVPFIFLTALQQLDDKLKGLKIGADDYITKPFEPEELLLRIINILNRTGSQAPGITEIGSSTFDYKKYQLVVAKTIHNLTEREADLLKILVENKNTVIKRSEILNSIWGEDDFFLGRSMDVFITRIRKYFKEDSSVQIRSVRGVGFILEVMNEF